MEWWLSWWLYVFCTPGVMLSYAEWPILIVIVNGMCVWSLMKCFAWLETLSQKLCFYGIYFHMVLPIYACTALIKCHNGVGLGCVRGYVRSQWIGSVCRDVNFSTMVWMVNDGCWQIQSPECVCSHIPEQQHVCVAPVQISIWFAFVHISLSPLVCRGQVCECHVAMALCFRVFWIWND